MTITEAMVMNILKMPMWTVESTVNLESCKVSGYINDDADDCDSAGNDNYNDEAFHEFDSCTGDAFHNENINARMLSVTGMQEMTMMKKPGRSPLDPRPPRPRQS